MSLPSLEELAAIVAAERDAARCETTAGDLRCQLAREHPGIDHLFLTASTSINVAEVPGAGDGGHGIVHIRHRGSVSYTDGIDQPPNDRRITPPLEAAALRFAADRLEQTGEKGTISSAALLRQLATEVES